MAEAAETQAFWTEIQVWITVGEVIALIIVITLTVWATKAAVEANRISREIANEDRRAWVSINSVSLMPGTQIQAEFMILKLAVGITNHGRTPATNVEIRQDSFFPKTTGKDFKGAKRRFEDGLSRVPVEMGHTIFPDEEYGETVIWKMPAQDFASDVTTRPDGSRKIGLTIFVGVSYRTFGIAEPRVTALPCTLLNVPIGYVVPDGTTISLDRMPFIAGKTT